MRKLTYIFVLVSVIGLAQEKSDLRSKVITGAPVNAQVKLVPEVLLKAYASGDLIGFFPNGKDTAGYRSMLAHFGMYEEAATHFDVKCDHQKVSIPWLIKDCMTMEFDLLETANFNKQTNLYEKKPDAIQVIFSASCPDNITGIEQDAVFFKLSDIESLPQNYTVLNIKNDAESYGIAEVLKLKLYDATPVKNGEWLDNPKTEGNGLKEVIVEEADELQDH